MKGAYKLLILVAVTVGLRLWVMTQAVAIARDGTGFIRMAQLLPLAPRAVLTSEVQHPLYPASLLAMHTLRRWLGGTDSPESWALSGQAVSILFSVGVLLLLFQVGREVFGPKAAWIACLLYVLLPEPTKIGANVLTDTCHFFWVLLALWLGWRGVQRGRAGWMALSGLAAGTAYLVRPEGLFVIVVVVWAIWFLKGEAARTGRWRVAASAGVVIGAAVTDGPYMAMIGGFSLKINYRQSGQFWSPSSSHPDGVPSLKPVPYPPLDAVRSGLVEAGPAAPTVAEEGRGSPGCWPGRLWAFSWKLDSMDWSRVKDGLNEFINDLAGTMHLLLVPFFLVGAGGVLLGATRLVRPNRPAAQYFGVFMGLEALMCLGVRILADYLSKRHVLPLAALGTVCAAVGLIETLAWWGRRAGRTSGSGSPPAAEAGPTGLSWPPSRLLALCIAVFAIPALWETSVPLNRKKGHKIAAGQYLRQHAGPTDRLVTDSCWVGFYADRPYVVTSGAGPDMDNDVLAPFLLQCGADWLSVLVRYDRLDEGPEYRQALVHRSRQVRNVPAEALRLERKFPDVAVPAFLEEALGPSPQIQWVENYHKAAQQPFRLYLEDPSISLDVSGSVVADALVRAATVPGTRGLVCGQTAAQARKLLSFSQRHIQATRLLAAVIKPSAPAGGSDELVRRRLDFANGSFLEFWFPGSKPAVAGPSPNYAWVASATKWSMETWTALRRELPAEATIRLYYMPNRVVYLYRVDRPVLEKAWAQVRAQRRQAAGRSS